jgi:predicted DNA-binding transcriptional regulator AlpA
MTAFSLSKASTQGRYGAGSPQARDAGDLRNLPRKHKALRQRGLSGNYPALFPLKRRDYWWRHFNNRGVAMQTQSKVRRWLSKREVAVRYGVSMRSVERWAASGKFPRGTQLPNKRWYWTDAEIELHERNLVGGEAA